MSAYPSTPSLAPLLQGPLQPIPTSGGFTADLFPFLRIPALKSFGILVTGMEGGDPGSPTSPESRVIPPQSAQNRRGPGDPGDRRDRKTGDGHRDSADQGARGRNRLRRAGGRGSEGRW